MYSFIAFDRALDRTHDVVIQGFASWLILAFGPRAPLRMFSTRRSLTSSGLAPDPPSTAALRRDIGESAAKAAERRPDAAGEVDFLEHCFIAEAVLIGSSITSRLGRNDPRVPSTKL